MFQLFFVKLHPNKNYTFLSPMGDKTSINKILPIAAMVLLFLFSGTALFAQHHESGADENRSDEIVEQEFKAGEMILEHITDSYEWHILTWNHTHISIYLPVILYDQGKWHVFSSKHLHHGEASYEGYHVAKEGFNTGKLVRNDAEGNEIRPDYDISFTKNVLAIFISIFLLMWIFISIANSYKKRKGHAPKGLQSLLEPLILFVRDDIAKASIGQCGEGDHIGTQLCQCIGSFHRRAAGGDDIFTDENPLTWADLKSATQFHLAPLALDKNRSHTQSTRQLVSGQYTAQSWSTDGIDRQAAGAYHLG